MRRRRTSPYGANPRSRRRQSLQPPSQVGGTRTLISGATDRCPSHLGHSPEGCQNKSTHCFALVEPCSPPEAGPQVRRINGCSYFWMPAGSTPQAAIVRPKPTRLDRQHKSQPHHSGTPTKTSVLSDTVVPSYCHDTTMPHSLDALRKELALAEARLQAAPLSRDAEYAVRWAQMRLQASETIELELLRAEARKSRLKAVVDPLGLWAPL